MLILTRKLGQSVVLYNDVYCTILGIQDNQVRLGFDAPRRIVIHREEIHKRILKDKELNETREKWRGSLKNSTFTLPETQLLLQENGHITH